MSGPTKAEARPELAVALAGCTAVAAKEDKPCPEQFVDEVGLGILVEPKSTENSS